jgi:small subunit ribosomal protein S4
VNVPSYQLKVGDRIEVRKSRTQRDPFKTVAANRSAQSPEWLTADLGKLTASVSDLPRRDQMPLDLNEQLVVEYYSR